MTKSQRMASKAFRLNKSKVKEGKKHMLFEIKSRFSEQVLFSLDCNNLKTCVEAAVKAEVSLRDSDLRGNDLRDSDLHDSDLRYSDLSGSDLRDSDLRGSDLRDSDLRYSDLRYSDLRGSDLRGSDLRGSDLSWNSHDLLAEILSREAGEDIKLSSFAGLVLLNRNWCWEKWLSVEITPELHWAASVLAKWIKPGNVGEHVDAIKQVTAEDGAREL